MKWDGRKEGMRNKGGDGESEGTNRKGGGRGKEEIERKEEKKESNG
jgi:hypothetical protein